MQLFQDTSFDFLGRAKFFVGISVLVALMGIASLAWKGGPRYGVEFQGGAWMSVQWPGAPPIAQIRAALAERLEGASILTARDRSGVQEVVISAPPGAARQTILEGLDSLHAPPYTVRDFELIGPQVSQDLRNQALRACLWASAGMLGYVAWRFEWSYGVAAVAAVVHDLTITLGLFSLFNQEITLTVVGALLTLIGYSMNDTIVVFDRIRENRGAGMRQPLVSVINVSINQTLSRTVLTSGLTLLTALALLWFGGAVLHGFALALVIGIVVGTYSSIFVASPILLAWNRVRGGVR